MRGVTFKAMFKLLQLFSVDLHDLLETFLVGLDSLLMLQLILFLRFL